MSAPLYRLMAAGTTHVGMKRKQNQDSFLVDLDLGLFIVADGMGGHLGGEVASRLAVDTIAGHLRTQGERTSLGVVTGIEAANSAIQERSKVDASLHGMGTTTTALYFGERELFVGHVGDSRGYFILPPGRIWQITRDHSLVQEKVRAGLIKREQMKTDKMRNVITRSVGFESEITVDLYQIEFHPGDVFVVCCDGVSNMLSDSEICTYVSETLQQEESIEAAAQVLIDQANVRGADDNVTAIVVRVEAT